MVAELIATIGKGLTVTFTKTVSEQVPVAAITE
jgi:hypothetical protein